jgi:hypothetical protein
MSSLGTAAGVALEQQSMRLYHPVDPLGVDRGSTLFGVQT